MPETKLSPLAVRKQLLIAESEVNRALLRQDCQLLAESLHQAAQPLRNFAAVAAAAAPLLSALNVFRRPPSGTPPKFWSFSNLVRLGMALWLGHREKKE